MDSVLADTLKANLKNASTEDAKLDALVLAMIAVVDCQLKTAERVKAIVEEREREKERRNGFLAAVGIIGSLIGAAASWLASHFFGGGAS
jgi:hypothetical protein